MLNIVENLSLPAKTIFASPVFTMQTKRFFPLAGKNLPTLVVKFSENPLTAF